MITKENEPIEILEDGGYVVQYLGYRYVVRNTDELGAFKIQDILEYVDKNPETLIKEKKDFDLSEEEKQRRKDIEKECVELELDMAWLREQRKKATD